jgi:hypothetical protein
VFINLDTNTEAFLSEKSASSGYNVMNVCNEVDVRLVE